MPSADETAGARLRTDFAWQRSGFVYLMFGGFALGLAAHRDELLLGAPIALVLGVLGLVVGRQRRVDVTFAATVCTALLAAVLVVAGG